MRLLYVAGLFLFMMAFGCKSTYMPSPRKAAIVRAAVTPSDSLISKSNSGVDFIASGNEPQPWTLEVDLETGFRFKAGAGITIIASAVAPVQEGNADVYFAKTDSGTMKVMIFKDPCKAEEKGKNIPVRCEVSLSGRNYKGCGSWLYNYILNDIWVLEYIEGKEIDFRAYNQKMPTLEFNLAENKMFGSDGCTDISSDITLYGNHIKFSAFAKRKLSCAGNAAERIFSSALSNRIVEYSIKNLQLTLFLFDDSKLVFKKVD